MNYIMNDESIDQKLVQVSELEVPNVNEIKQITGLSTTKSYALRSVLENQQYETAEEIVEHCPESYRFNEQVKPLMLKLAKLIVAQRPTSSFPASVNDETLQKLLNNKKELEELRGFLMSALGCVTYLQSQEQVKSKFEN